jgi:formylglycine-generating enzyme required for sulfatase activity/energy-coupling factor transporter ATP-binding protein EcfA2
MAIIITDLLATALVSLAQKFIEKGVIEPKAESLKRLVSRKFNKKQAEQELQEAFVKAIKQTGQITGEKEIEAYYQKIKLDRLQAEHNDALRRTVALALVGHTDPNAPPPQALVTALGWSPTRTEELSELLANLRAALADTCWKPLIDYADQAEEKGLLRDMLGEISALSNTIVSTPEGEALRVVVVKQLGLSDPEVKEIEAEYRALVKDAFRKHRIQGLAQFEKIIHLNLEEIYQDLNLRLLKPREAQEKDLDAEMKADTAERLARSLRDANQRINSVLGENPRLVIVGKPGSGKTTTLKYIALMLAMGDAGAACLQLSAPRIPIYLRLGEYAQALKEKPSLSLETYLNQYLTEQFAGVKNGSAFLQAALSKGTCYILLDGLDEVGDFGEKLSSGQTLHQKVLKEVQRFADQRCGERCKNWIIVTSRLEGYRQNDLSDFVEMELCPLNLPDEVEAFLMSWYRAYLMEYDDQLTQKYAEAQAHMKVEKLMGSIMRSASIKLLAANPLLLTILVVISENLNTPLPNRRAELFKIVAETLVKNWRHAQTDHQQRIYDHPYLTDTDVYFMMTSLAYWIHENKPGGTMPIAEWKGKITELLADYVEEEEIEGLVDEFIRHAKEETGLLAERSPGEIGFFHLTLEEYLAAVEIARNDGSEQLERVSKHWQDPYWQETLLLTAGELAQRGNRKLLASFLTNFLTFESTDLTQAGRNVFLAGRALVDIGANSVSRSAQRLIKHDLQLVAQDKNFDTEQPNEPGLIAPKLRADCADTLDELGYVLDDLYTFVEIPGTDTIPTFWMAKYLVTNGQYARFLTPENFRDKTLWKDFPQFASPEEGYRDRGKTGDAGWTWLQRELQDKDNLVEAGVLYPRYWRDSRFGAQRVNAPVVGVSWWEANAYARWLLTHWDKLVEGQQGMAKPARLRLPREDEWVKATLGPAALSPAAGGPGVDGDADGRFAFGGLENPKEDITQYCNTYESGIRQTTPVWTYPRGKSPHGVMDMSGNVWEWQMNRYRNDKDWWARRGGSWSSSYRLARVANRNDHSWGIIRHHDIGFRLVSPPVTPS